MKTKILVYSTIFSLLSLGACMEEDDEFATEIAADGDIYISIPEKALPAPPLNQPQVEQPSLDVTTGKFAITDDFNMTIALSEGLTNLKINSLTTAGVRHEKASFTGIDGPIDFAYRVDQLANNNAAPGVNTNAVLELIASNDDGSKTATRVFAVAVQDPLTLATTNPVTGYADSLITFTYAVPAASTLAAVTKVEVLAKRGKNGAETVVATKNYTAGETVVTGSAGTISYKMPPENLTQLDTLFVRFRASYATGRSVIRNVINSTAYTVRFINVPMSVTTTGLTLYNSAVTGTNAARTGYDFGKLTYIDPAATGTTEAQKEAARDFKLLVNGADIGFTSGTDNNTRFLKVAATDYTSTKMSFQFLRDLFTAPGATPVTTVNNVYVGDVYIVEIDGGKGSAKYGIFRVTAVTLTPNTNASDFITFEFKSK